LYFAVSCTDIARATISVVPPGGKGTTIRIVSVGYFSAVLIPLTVVKDIRAAVMSSERMVYLLM
jgi:hypothetical protein